MELLSGIPVVGQYSIVGLLVGFVVFIVVQIIRGELVPLSRVAQWQKAWEISMQTNKDLAQVASDTKVVAETLTKLVSALPQPQSTEEGEPR